MNKRNIFSILLLLAGEALIIISFLYFGSNLDNEILALNIIVSSIIYSLLFIDILIPMVDFKDKSQKVIGSLGIRWFVTSLYLLSAVGVMVTFILVKPVDIYSQILIQAMLFFLLLLGMYSAASSSDKVKERYTDEKQMLSRVEDVKKAIKEVQNKIDQIKNAPSDILFGITSLQEDLRFIAPCNNQEAIELESHLLVEIETIKDRLFEFPLNSDRITENIQNCKRICIARKQIYSN